MLAFVVLIPACLTFISISGVSSGPEGDQLCVQATARNLRTQGESHLLMLVLCYMYPHVETFGRTIHQAVTCLYYRLSRSITENRNVVLVPAHSVAACSMLRRRAMRVTMPTVKIIVSMRRTMAVVRPTKGERVRKKRTLKVTTTLRKTKARTKILQIDCVSLWRFCLSTQCCHAKLNCAVSLHVF